MRHILAIAGILILGGAAPAVAGRLPVAGWAEARATADVSGRPAPAVLVREAALAAATTRVHPAPGASHAVSGDARGVVALAPGDRCAVAVPVRIQAPGRVTVDAVVTVQLRNLGLAAAAADRLLYSNDPESVFATGRLYQAAAEAGEVSRLFFHHQNRAGRPLRFVASLVNPNDTAVDCLLTAGTAGPHGDPVLAGSRAAARFLAQYRDSAGVVVRIPPRATRVLTDRAAKELDTVSGIIDLRPLTGAPLICQVQALGPGEGDTGAGVSLATARATAEMYRPAHKEFTARYTLGGRWLFLDIGQAPVARIDGQGHLHGDYGVMYSAELELVNPLPTPQRIMLALAPRGGWARGAFLVDGRVVEIGAGYPPTECPIATVRLEPGETRRVTVDTFPTGGSSYPAWLVARPAATAAGGPS